MEKVRVLILILLASLSVSCQRKTGSDYQAVNDLLVELEKDSIFPTDIYFRYPPPPAEPWDSIVSATENNRQMEFKRFEKWKNVYEAQQEEIRLRDIDSTFTFLIVGDTLMYSCPECSIRPDSLLKIPEYSRYQPLVESLNGEILNSIKLKLDQIAVNGRYKLKSESDFPNRTLIYENPLDFLCGGEIWLSRFYSDRNLGIFFMEIATCPSDCSAGYLVLMEFKEERWQIFDLLLQYIS
jgi:hypothetical protein